ncbi:MAG: GIY-YIG nuclease family protein [Candidatus Zixiibacteriota bacterium]
MYSYVYIMTCPSNKVLYIGVTSDLKARVFQHRESLIPGFTQKYQVNRLVYFEVFSDVTLAIAREKQLKGGSRKKKVALVDSVNPKWRDLWNEI